MQQIQRVNLKAIKRCDQVWENMKPIKGGRQCEMCQKKITDFRNKTLKEIAEAHVYSDESVCGIYTENQLNNQENVLEIEKVTWWNSLKTGYLSFVSFFITLATSAQDSNSVPKARIEQKESPVLDSVTVQPPPKEKYIIRGEILDENKVPLEFANVVIRVKSNIITGASTNKEGEYSLDLSSILDTIPEQFSLEFSYIGYSVKKIIVAKKDLKTNIRTTTLNSDSTELRELVLEVNTVLGDGLTSISSFGVISKDTINNKNKEDVNNIQIDSKKQNWLGRLWKSIKNVFSGKDRN